MKRYIVNLTGRRDGSSRFGPDNRFGNFGAVGAAWLISEESWMKNVRWLTALRKSEEVSELPEMTGSEIISISIPIQSHPTSTTTSQL